jgi:hypothetical protein
MDYLSGMDLKLSMTGDYAVRAAISLARNYGNGYRKIREVAVEMALPLRYTPPNPDDARPRWLCGGPGRARGRLPAFPAAGRHHAIGGCGGG